MEGTGSTEESFFLPQMQLWRMLLKSGKNMLKEGEKALKRSEMITSKEYYQFTSQNLEY